MNNVIGSQSGLRGALGLPEMPSGALQTHHKWPSFVPCLVYSSFPLLFVALFSNHRPTRCGCPACSCRHSAAQKHNVDHTWANIGISVHKSDFQARDYLNRQYWTRWTKGLTQSASYVLAALYPWTRWLTIRLVTLSLHASSAFVQCHKKEVFRKEPLCGK